MGLEKRRITNSLSVEDIFTINDDFSHVEERLSKMKEISLSYLAEAFKDFLND